MFVQLNPDLDSYSETLSTLKFAERVSGIELGGSRSNKEGKDVRELMDQVLSNVISCVLQFCAFLATRDWGLMNLCFPIVSLL